MEIKPQPVQEKFLASQADIAIYGGSAGSGKAMSLNTLIPTTTGWTVLRDITDADVLLDEQGQPCRILQVHEVFVPETAYRLTFDEGSVVECCGDHLWFTTHYESDSNLRKSSVKTTTEIAQTLWKYNRINHAIPLGQSWQLPEADLPIDPYIFGMEMETIPEVYLRASHEQRLALLRGLMDSRGQALLEGSFCRFSTQDFPLADRVHELAISLGIKARLMKDRSLWRVCFSTDLPVFTDETKLRRQMKRAQRMNYNRVSRNRYRYIHQAERIESVPMRCLTVDSPSRLFLCGRSGIPTHNTFALLMEPVRHSHNPNFGAVIFRREAKQINNEGGLRDTALRLYPGMGAVFRGQPSPSFVFPSGARVTFAHLNQETDVAGWQGSQIPLICYDELTHFCLTPDHDVLTQTGWIPIDEVTVRHKALALAVTGEVYWTPIREVLTFEHDGPMIEWDTERFCTQATPNHRLPVKTAARSPWRFKTVEQLTKESRYLAITTGEPIEQSGAQELFLGTHSDGLTLPIKDYVEILAAYLLYGHLEPLPPYTIQFAPAIFNDPHFKRLTRRFPKERPQLQSCPLYEHFRDLGIKERRLPKLLLLQSARILEHFLKGFGGEIAGPFGLMSDLQALCALIGWEARMTESEADQVYRLFIRSRRRTTILKDPKVIEYAGTVWCLQIPGVHNFLVRRRGRCHFTGNSSSQFWYMLSRNRSDCGVKPYIRASCNPDPDSWVAEFIRWWIDQETGYPIERRSGKLRYFLRRPGATGGTEFVWGSNAETVLMEMGLDPPIARELREAQQQILDARRNGEELPDDDGPVSYAKGLEAIRSVTFVSAKIYDNPALLMSNPTYLANLKALSRVDRGRLLDGNWKIRAAGGLYFPSEEADFLNEVPTDIQRWVRSWDLAATEATEEHDADWTVGVKMGRRPNGQIVVADVIRIRRNASFVREIVKATAELDGKSTLIRIPQDPGQAGRAQIESFHELLRGYNVYSRVASRNKTTLAEPCAAEWQSGRFLLVRAPWNKAFLDELERFPDGAHDDCVDALSGGHGILPAAETPDYSTGGLSRHYR